MPRSKELVYVEYEHIIGNPNGNESPKLKLNFFCENYIYFHVLKFRDTEIYQTPSTVRKLNT